MGLSRAVPALVQPVLPPSPDQEGRDDTERPQSRCKAAVSAAPKNMDGRDTKQLGGGRVRVVGTYGAAARRARWVYPSATVPRRRSRPCTASFPSRSSNLSSTRRRTAPCWSKSTPPGPGRQHRDGWLGAAPLKGVSVQFWDITLTEYSFVYYSYTWLLQPSSVAVLVLKKMRCGSMGFYFFSFGSFIPLTKPWVYISVCYYWHDCC